jgi:hypothetical protein
MKILRENKTTSNVFEEANNPQLNMLAFDIETTGLCPQTAKVTVVCTEDFFTGEKKAYEFARISKHEPHNLKLLITEMVNAFDDAESLCAFNGVRFDLPFLHQAFKLPDEQVSKWLAKCSDILEACRLQFFGPRHTFGLNLLCSANDIMQKSSSGIEAITMANEGRWDDLNAYCHDDVSILCALYRKQHLKNPRRHKTIDLSCIAHDNLYTSLGMVRRLDNIAQALVSSVHNEQLQEVRSFVLKQQSYAQNHEEILHDHKRQIIALTNRVKTLETENESFAQMFAEF